MVFGVGRRGRSGFNAGAAIAGPAGADEVGPALASGPPRTDRIRIWSAFPLWFEREEGPEAPWRGPGLGPKGPVPSIPSRINVTPGSASRSLEYSNACAATAPKWGSDQGEIVCSDARVAKWTRRRASAS